MYICIYVYMYICIHTYDMVYARPYEKLMVFYLKFSNPKPIKPTTQPQSLNRNFRPHKPGSSSNYPLVAGYRSHMVFKH